MNKIKQINNYFENMDVRLFVIVMILLSFILLIPLAFIFYFLGFNILNIGSPQATLNLYNSKDSPVISIISIIAITSIVVPIFESFLYQLIIIRILQMNKFINNHKIIIIILSALAFGWSHSYSIMYFFQMFIFGILLAYSFIIYDKKKFHPFWVIVTIHSLRNLLSTFFLIIFYLK